MAKLNFKNPAASADVNASFLGRDVDDTATGVIALANVTDVNSGAATVNTQRYINEIADSDGTVGEGDANRKVYSSNNYIADGDNRKVAIGKTDARLKVNSDSINVNAANISANTTDISENTILMVAVETITASGEVATALNKREQYRRVVGDAGAQSANVLPFSNSQTFDDGTVIYLVGTDDTNTVTFALNDISYGLMLNGTATLLNGYILKLIYDNVALRYYELSRNF